VESGNSEALIFVLELPAIQRDNVRVERGRGWGQQRRAFLCGGGGREGEARGAGRRGGRCRVQRLLPSAAGRLAPRALEAAN